MCILKASTDAKSLSFKTRPEKNPKPFSLKKKPTGNPIRLKFETRRTLLNSLKSQLYEQCIVPAMPYACETYDEGHITQTCRNTT